MDIQKIIESPIFRRTVSSVLVVLIVFIFWRIASAAYKRFIAKKLDIGSLGGNAASVAYSVIGIVKFIVILVVVLLLLQINGVNVTSLFAGLGIASAIVGLALQDYLKDVIMGFHILTDNYFRIGDIVKYGNEEGEVVAFSLRTTKIRSLKTLDMITISNRNISEISRSSDLVVVDLPLSYEDDYEKADEVLTKCCERIDTLEHARKCVYKGTSDFGSSAVIYKILFYCPPKFRGDTRRAALRILQEEVKKAGLTIPYEQVDVHTKD
ncbi:MAG: mechanosensitive ion channel family protein [Lachnospiraceae bacterium]|nr:mechanosensitive ion channel family protein [Lachnospiraceae bacterium]